MSQSVGIVRVKQFGTINVSIDAVRDTDGSFYGEVTLTAGDHSITLQGGSDMAMGLAHYLLDLASQLNRLNGQQRAPKPH